MPQYQFHLHDGATVKPRTEAVPAEDDDEARSLAEMRLLLSRDFTHVEVFRDGIQRFALERDSAHR